MYCVIFPELFIVVHLGWVANQMRNITEWIVDHFLFYFNLIYEQRSDHGPNRAQEGTHEEATRTA